MINAQTVLETVEQVYSRCSTYQDRGRLTKSGLGTPASIEFATSFKRPEKFRFSWSGTSWLTDEKKRTTLSHDGEKTAQYDPTDGTITYSDDPRTAILKDGINSWHAVEIILQLLTPNFGEFSVNIKRLDDCRLITSAEPELTPYYLLEGSSGRKRNDTRVWVRQSDFAVIRVSIEREHGSENRSFDQTFPGVADKYGPAMAEEIRTKWRETKGSSLRIIEFINVHFDRDLKDHLFEQRGLHLLP